MGPSTVDAHRIIRRFLTRNWLLRNRVTLPGAEGPVEAGVKGALRMSCRRSARWPLP
jgi:hypothetical protein